MPKMFEREEGIQVTNQSMSYDWIDLIVLFQLGSKKLDCIALTNRFAMSARRWPIQQAKFSLVISMLVDASILILLNL